MVKDGTAKVESLRSKALYKLELYLIKIIPMLMALGNLVNTILAYFYIDVPLLSYMCGTSILVLMFLYLSSYVFRFCKYHRMFIHYVTFNWLLNIIDYYIGIPLNSKDLFFGYLIVTGITMFTIVYLKFKKK